jgi:hypothetical protein
MDLRIDRYIDNYFLQQEKRTKFIEYSHPCSIIYVSFHVIRIVQHRWGGGLLLKSACQDRVHKALTFTRGSP